MSYAYKLITFLLGVLMVPLTTIMFSRMSRQAAAKNRDGVLASLRSSILLISLVALPIIAVGMTMANDVVKMIYMRGNSNLESVKLTGSILMFYLIGVLGFGFRDFMNRTFHALQDTKTPFKVACLVVGSNIVLNFILRSLMGANGLALATSISGFVGCAVLIILLRKRFGHIGFRSVMKELVKIVVATAVCAVVCVFMNRIVPEAIGTLRVFGRLALCAGASLIVYAICCLVLKVKTLTGLASSLLRRK